MLCTKTGGIVEASMFGKVSISGGLILRGYIYTAFVRKGLFLLAKIVIMLCSFGFGRPVGKPRVLLLA